MALFRPFKISEFMSVTVGKAEVISEKSENPFSMSAMWEQNGLKSLAVNTSQFNPKRPLQFKWRNQNYAGKLLVLVVLIRERH